MIKDGDQYILVDPIFFDLFRMKDFSPLAFDLLEMPFPERILITHGHFDHLDTRSISHPSRLRRSLKSKTFRAA